ncbi:MAG: aspartyl protease family protein [Acidobacteria bacterium]|nr:aspartyl protease family protein [Acidobacteriota bacterium]
MKRLRRPAVGSLAAFVFCAALGATNVTFGAVASATAPAGEGDKTRGRADHALRAGDFEDAEKIYRELLAKHPQDVAVRLGLSHALLKQRKIQDAFDQAARVVAVEPMSARAHALIGAALLAAGDFRVSVEEFRTALSFKDDEAIAVAGLAMIDFYENRLTSSMEGLRRAAFLDPDEPDYYYNLGQVSARSERYAEAARAYERFLRIAPRTDADRRARIRGLIDFLRYLGTQGDLLRVGGASRNVISFDLTNNRPIVTVRINNSKEPLRFVVDTGAGMTVISTNAAERLGLSPVARGGMARAIGGGGRFEIVYGFIQSLHIGDAHVERVPVYIRPFFNAQEPVDGYVGLSILSKFLSSVDYGACTLQLLRDDAIPAYNPVAPPPGIEIPIRVTSSGFWSGEIKIEGIEKPVNFIIDTGASISVISEALAAREDMGRFAQKSRIQIYGAAGLTENVQTLMLPAMFLGSHTRKNVPAAVLDLGSINETAGFEQTGIVGGNVLRNFRVTFDFAHGVVRLEPIRNAPADDAKTPIVTSQT